MLLRRSTQWGAAALAVMLGLIAMFYGCSETPFEPVSPTMGYAVHFWEGDRDGKFYRYYPKTGTIDSVTISSSVLPTYDFNVSANGQRMYIHQGSTVAVVEISTGEVVTFLPYPADNGYGVRSSRDNSMIAVQSRTGLRILDAQSFELLFEDTTLNVSGAWFSADNQRIYCGGAHNDSDAVLIIDVANDFSVTPRVFGGGGICRVRPTGDEKTWYLLRNFGYSRAFQVYDVVADSIIFEHPLLGGRGEMEMTPDGRYVFLNEPGDLQWGTGPSYFTTYDSQSKSIDTVSTIGIADGTNPEYMPIDEMAVTPDGKWMVAGEAIGGDSFLRFNIETMEIDSYTQFHSGGLGTFACQVGQ